MMLLFRFLLPNPKSLTNALNLSVMALVPNFSHFTPCSSLKTFFVHFLVFLCSTPTIQMSKSTHKNYALGYAAKFQKQLSRQSLKKLFLMPIHTKQVPINHLAKQQLFTVMLAIFSFHPFSCCFFMVTLNFHKLSCLMMILMLYLPMLITTTCFQHHHFTKTILSRSLNLLQPLCVILPKKQLYGVPTSLTKHVVITSIMCFVLKSKNFLFTLTISQIPFKNIVKMKLIMSTCAKTSFPV
mmetsp:Transcript_19363/g.28868  ORF Transcript_19363/g.28868 Transcript_19363/m.28868 type:complete len:240 (-) Transcript_19363:131-850(-)